MATEKPNENFPFLKLDLDPSCDNIRLLRLDAAQSTADALAFTMECHSVQATSFIALSYTWARYEEINDDAEPLRAVSEQQVESITVNGSAFMITPTLKQFLSVTTPGKLKDRPFFVDQICIDQSHGEEKTHQVQLMAAIYGEAAEIIVWMVALAITPSLGGPSYLAEDDEALEILKAARKPINPLRRRRAQGFCKMIAQDFAAHLCSAFWTRQWTLQEVLLAKQLSFQIGEHNFDWEVVINLIMRYAFLQSSRSDRKQLLEGLGRLEIAPIIQPYQAVGNHSANEGGSSMTRWGSRNMPVETYCLMTCTDVLLLKQKNRDRDGRFIKQHISVVLTRLGGRNCNVRRDGIFSLLSLADTSIRVDYRKTMSALYLELLKEGIHQYLIRGSERKDASIAMPTFINAALMACDLDLREATVDLITVRMLAHFELPEKVQGDLVKITLYMARYGFDEREKLTQRLEEVVWPQHDTLWNEILRYKGEGGG